MFLVVNSFRMLIFVNFTTKWLIFLFFSAVDQIPFYCILQLASTNKSNKGSTLWSFLVWWVKKCFCRKSWYPFDSFDAKKVFKLSWKPKNLPTNYFRHWEKVFKEKFRQKFVIPAIYSLPKFSHPTDDFQLFSASSDKNILYFDENLVSFCFWANFLENKHP